MRPYSGLSILVVLHGGPPWWMKMRCAHSVGNDVGSIECFFDITSHWKGTPQLHQVLITYMYTAYMLHNQTEGEMKGEVDRRKARHKQWGRNKSEDEEHCTVVMLSIMLLWGRLPAPNLNPFNNATASNYTARLWPTCSLVVAILRLGTQRGRETEQDRMRVRQRTCPHALSVLVSWCWGCQKPRLLTHLLGCGQSLTWGQRERRREEKETEGKEDHL